MIFNEYPPFFPGLQVHDTCNSEELTQKHLYHIISNTREAASVLRLKSPAGPPLLGKSNFGSILVSISPKNLCEINFDKIREYQKLAF